MVTDTLRTLGRLLAQIHALPTEWYAPHWEASCARFPRIATAQHYSPVRRQLTYGAQSFQKKLAALSAAQMDTFLGEYGFQPMAPAISGRTVTCHGDFGAHNVVRSESSGRLTAIDFEQTFVGPAVIDLANALWNPACNGGGDLVAKSRRKRAFLAEYLATAGLPCALALGHEAFFHRGITYAQRSVSGRCSIDMWPYVIPRYVRWRHFRAEHAAG
eukprot:SAG11_NODE_5470_length_1551_cov_1.406336_1_plen_216_part_00